MRQERGSSMKKFTQQELKERLGFNADEVKLIMKAQREFPELLVEEDEFVINSLRKLYLQLGMDMKNWARWKQKNVLDNEFFKQNKDWWVLVTMKTTEKGGQVADDYKVSIEFAKHLAMVVKNENGHTIRTYFILMEKAVKKMRNWIVIREPQKAGYIEMCKMLDQEYRETHNGDESNNFLYSNNADMINLCLMGYKSKKIKQVMNLEYKDSLRDSLTAEFNKALYELQILNGNLVLSHIDFKTRRMIIQNTCTAKYMDLRTRVASEFHMEFKTIKED